MVELAEREDDYDKPYLELTVLYGSGISDHYVRQEILALNTKELDAVYFHKTHLFPDSRRVCESNWVRTHTNKSIEQMREEIAMDQGSIKDYTKIVFVAGPPDKFTDWEYERDLIEEMGGGQITVHLKECQLIEFNSKQLFQADQQE